MPLRPDALCRGAFLVAAVVDQAEPEAAVESSVGFIVCYQAPAAVVLEKGRFAVREAVVVGFAIVDADAVDFALVYPAEVVAGFPIEVFSKASDEVGLAYELAAGDFVVGAVEVL